MSEEQTYVPAYDYTELVGTYVREEPSKWQQAVEKPDLLGWFVGKIMKDTDGKADPAMVLAELFRRAEIARAG